jgi:hypothetical protein
MMVDVLMSKTRIMSPYAAQTRKSAKILREVQSQDQIKLVSKTTTPGKVLSLQSPPIIPERQF